MGPEVWHSAAFVGLHGSLTCLALLVGHKLAQTRTVFLVVEPLVSNDVCDTTGHHEAGVSSHAGGGHVWLWAASMCSLI